MTDGPTIRNIPEQKYKVCHGCIYLKTSSFKMGHKSVTKNYSCSHPQVKKESIMLGYDDGKLIHFNHEGDCTTPDWCPFLKQ